ncbi:hypothetical protein SLEP1_g35661 [Rubroshorea leprosula]|uniref:Uncharacterized protein n=1 Tax=Rubroshorea leprosula TaxID=152421 RepID=A0AAV5KNX0_9ROSI|nr:hypothetical protein SLEP1_g35661 [Rubroshorea leprosula]
MISGEGLKLRRHPDKGMAIETFSLVCYLVGSSGFYCWRW